MDKEVREKNSFWRKATQFVQETKNEKNTLTQMLQDYKKEKEQIFSECYNLHEVI
jgi:hypothetical protein